MKLKLNMAEKPHSNGNIVRSHGRGFWITCMILTLLISYSLYIPRGTSLTGQILKPGDIAREDIIVKHDVTLQDDFSTREKISEARANVPPVYELYSRSPDSQPLLNEWFDFMRRSRRRFIREPKSLSEIKAEIEKRFGFDLKLQETASLMRTTAFGKIDLERLTELMNSLRDNGIITSKLGAVKSSRGTVQRYSNGEDPKTLKVNAFNDLKDVRSTLERFLRNQTLTSAQVQLVVPVLMEFVDVNLSYSPNLTSIARDEAANRVNPVMVRLKAGKVILRKGDEVTSSHMRLIRLISIEEENRKQHLPDFFLILAVMGTMLFFLIRLWRLPLTETLDDEKLPIVMVVTLAVSVGIYRISVFLLPMVIKNIAVVQDIDPQGMLLAIPFGIGALIIAFIFNLQSAVIFSFANAMTGAIISGWNFRISLYILMGNLAISFGIEYYQRLKRSPILKAAIFWLLPVNLAFILLMDLTRPDSIDTGLIISHLIMGALSAFIAPLFANFIIPLWEMMFKLVTNLKLIELTNLNLPIFRQMLENAPGTYHHSQMVASLAESCAPGLRISPLLLTAMALYHDIGKIGNPQFFTENQTIYSNPHINLSPRESAKMIIAHLNDGLEEAKKLKLPQPIRDAILQHHGTKLVHFFYDKAKGSANVDTDEIDISLFRYPGRKPQTIENAIIMLADQVEAASKTLASPTDDEIRNVIQQIIESNVEENQFDECEDLTFSALNHIAHSFYKKLSSIYHMRVSYPGFNFTENENGHDTNS